jgi:hypothetical protein
MPPRRHFAELPLSDLVAAHGLRQKICLVGEEQAGGRRDGALGELVVGRHGFSALSERDTNRDGQSTIVHVESAEITTDEHLIRFRITASHFCGRWEGG